QQHRPVGVGQPDLAEQQEQRERGGGAGDHHPAQDHAEQQPAAAEVVDRHGVSGGGRQQGGAQPADHRVQQAVQRPAQEDPVVGGEHLVQVGAQVPLGGGEAEGAEQVGG